MPSVEPDTRIGFPLMRQDWRSTAFVHWVYPPTVVQRLVPPPFELDTYNGLAWVGLTPFTTTLALFAAVPLPGPRRFPETNVRTYVRAPDGTDGVWFLSLDVTNLANVPLGRLGLPYHWSDMIVEHDGSAVRYRGKRRGEHTTGYDVELHPCEEPLTEQSPLDAFLTGRWHTYTRRWRTRFDIWHEPWPLRRAEVGPIDETMLERAGLPAPGPPAIAHYASGVNVAIGWPQSVRKRGGVSQPGR